MADQREARGGCGFWLGFPSKEGFGFRLIGADVGSPTNGRREGVSGHAVCSARKLPSSFRLARCILSAASVSVWTPARCSSSAKLTPGRSKPSHRGTSWNSSKGVAQRKYTLRRLPFGLGEDLGHRARPMKVDIRVEMLAVKCAHRLGVARIDVAETNVLANDGPVLAFHQPVVAGVMRPRLGLLDEQFVQKLGHGVVDELAAIVGMEAADHKGKLREHGFQHRK